MRVLLQRVTKASVAVGGSEISSIGQGLLALVCAMPHDDEETSEKLAAKVAKMRIFSDADGKMNLSVLDVGGAVLVVSQFTLAADTSRGNRPGYSGAARPELGEKLYLYFAQALEDQGLEIGLGQFGADMAVSLVNDGPVTIWLDSDG